MNRCSTASRGETTHGGPEDPRPNAFRTGASGARRTAANGWNEILATKKVFDVVPTCNPPDIRWSRHPTETEAEEARKQYPHEACVRGMWIVEDETELDEFVEKLDREPAVDVHIARGMRHWDEIRDWREEAALADTIRVSVGPTTGVVVPVAEAVHDEIVRQRRAHATMTLPPEPWYLEANER